MGHFGVSYLELLILFEQWAGHRLLNAKVVRRPISFSSVPVSEAIEIRHGCQYISSLVRALAKLPDATGRFMPCGVGSHMSRLRHLGRPLESCHHQCLKAACGVLGYPKGSAAELLDGLRGDSKRKGVTSAHLIDARSSFGKRVRLTKKSRPSLLVHDFPAPGHPTPRRWKRLRPPSSEGEGSEVGVPRNLFPRLGVG